MMTVRRAVRPRSAGLTAIVARSAAATLCLLLEVFARILLPIIRALCSSRSGIPIVMLTVPQTRIPHSHRYRFVCLSPTFSICNHVSSLIHLRIVAEKPPSYFSCLVRSAILASRCLNLSKSPLLCLSASSDNATAVRALYVDRSTSC